MNLQIEICSITHKKALEKVFEKHHPQILINAAAHTHVPLMEHNCVEAIYNNVFGNVLGSAGSVIPLFRRQIANGGPVTVTDKRIIRYFMTIPEASQLVLQSGAMAKNGELFVLDMGKPVKIYDLAERI